jgi:tetratricopeptide (TPR) repeat protein
MALALRELCGIRGSRAAGCTSGGSSPAGKHHRSHGGVSGGRALAVPRNTVGSLFLSRQPPSARYQALMHVPLNIGLWAVLFASCQGVGRGLPPAKVTGLPWGDAPADQLAWAARQDVSRGNPERALIQLRTILAEEPRHVDANRLRQDVLRTRGRSGMLLVEARDAVRARPTDGLAHYLLGRVTSDPGEKLASFSRAAELSPESVWPWLGLAHTLRSVDQQRSLDVYEGLYAASQQHPLVGVAFASALRQDDRLDAAADVYEKMRKDAQVPGVGDLGIAQLSLAGDDRSWAWASSLLALRQRPYDPGVQALIHGWLEMRANPDSARQILNILREDQDRLRAFGSGNGASVLAALMRQQGQPQAARAVIERQLSIQPAPKLRREQRRLLASLGEVRAFLDCLQRDIPLHVVDVEANQVRGRWLHLLRGPWMTGEPLPDSAQTKELLAALCSVGLLVEVELLCEIARLKFPDQDTVWDEMQADVRRELAFEAGLRSLLYSGYSTKNTAGLEDVFSLIRELSIRVLGHDVVGKQPQFAVPLVGEMMNPFEGDLAAYLAHYNRHLVLGRRAGGTAEGLLVNRLSVTELPEVEQLELKGRCYEVVGMDRDIQALGGVMGGDLAGVALLNHFLIDYDSVVDWAAGLLDRRQVARTDGLALVSDPIPDNVGMNPIDASWRLTLVSSVDDEDLEAAVLSMIRDHERRHLVDSFHYMPIESNLLRGAGLLFQFGLSPAAIEAEMERRAELAALALSPHTELVLAHIVDFYGDPPLKSPHHVGFSSLAEQLHQQLIKQGVSADRALPSQWHTLEMASVRAAARTLLADLP